MTALGTSRRSRRLFLWLARLAVVVYVAQIAAFDHWQSDATRIFGVEGSSAHVLHCHGDASGCADGATGLVGTLTEAALTPLPPAAVPAALLDARSSPAQPFLPVADEPPRAA